MRMPLVQGIWIGKEHRYINNEKNRGVSNER